MKSDKDLKNEYDRIWHGKEFDAKAAKNLAHFIDEYWEVLLQHEYDLRIKYMDLYKDNPKVLVDGIEKRIDSSTISLSCRGNIFAQTVGSYRDGDIVTLFNLSDRSINVEIIPERTTCQKENCCGKDCSKPIAKTN